MVNQPHSQEPTLEVRRPRARRQLTVFNDAYRFIQLSLQVGVELDRLRWQDRVALNRDLLKISNGYARD